MKRYAPLLLTFLFLPLLFSCFDLEEDLYDQLEKEDYYTDYESLMASVLRPYEHAKWAETNFSFWLQELSADQLVITQKREHWEDGGMAYDPPAYMGYVREKQRANVERLLRRYRIL